MKENNSKKILIPLSNGFEETEYIAVKDVLIRNKFDVKSISFNNSEFVISNNETVMKVDIVFTNISDLELEKYLVLYIPGGSENVNNLDKNANFDSIINYFSKNKKLISALCAAPILLAKRNLLKNKDAVVYPDEKFINILEKSGANYINNVEYIGDENIFTGTRMQISIEFAEKLANFINEYINN